jgi:4-hydroxybenzoate polyprenyltransferase
MADVYRATVGQCQWRDLHRAPQPAKDPAVTGLLASIARLHIVAIGALGTFTFGWALTGHYAPWLALLSATDWFVVNLLNRVVDLVEDEHNHIAGAELVRRHRRRTVIVGVAVLLVSLLASAIWWPDTLWARLPFHALGTLYNWRLLPFPSGRRRIKELMLWKNVASATGFLLTCFAMPLLVHPLHAGVSVATVVVTMAFFFFFELSYEVLYDLRDVDGDRLAGVKTWPVLFGVRGGSAIAVGQMLTAVGIVVGGAVAGVLPWHLTIMGVAPVMQLVAVWPRLPDRVTSSLCIGVTWLGVALLGAYHVWELLGLPGSTGGWGISS